MCKPISELRGMTAQDILKFCRQEDNIPVDLESVLHKFGISSIPFNFTKIEEKIKECANGNNILGALATNGDKAAIFYSIADKRDSHRYRFTIAHELGHCALNHFPIESSTVHLMFRKDGEAQNKMEFSANVFAGELLIPEDQLMSVIHDLLSPSVDVLAEIFDVSDNVMKARLAYLGVNEKIRSYNC